MDQGPLFTLDGVREPIPDPAGKTMLLLELDPDDPDRSRVELFSRDGLSLIQLTAHQLEWAALSSDGQHIALGTLSAVRVLGGGGQELLQLPFAEGGALSPDGSWIVLEREAQGQRQLELTPLAAPPLAARWSHPVPGTSSSLTFAGATVLRVSSRKLQVVDTRPTPPVFALELDPPNGFLWRDAALSPSGELAASRIHVDRPALLQPSQQGPVYVPGAARVGVDLIDLSNGARRSLEWDVTLWNHESPQLAFDASGKLYAVVWPSAHEVRVP